MENHRTARPISGRLAAALSRLGNQSARTFGVAGVCLMALSVGGCALPSSPSVSSRPAPATAGDPRMGGSDYWFRLPAVDRVESSDYDALWNAAERVAVQSSFSIERVDYRNGLLTTKPLVSRQFFELWKGDIADPRSQSESDTATRRRVVHFQISKLAGGQYICEPKVVVEHYSMTERRITSVYQYQDAFSTRRQFQEERTDEGTAVRAEYWYAERRDEALEHAIVEENAKNTG